MQEKVKKKKNRLTARLEARDVNASRAWIVRAIVELAYVGIAYVIGNARLAFETAPLGVALLCAGRRHVLSILIGLILSSLFLRREDAVVYLVAYVLTALVRLLSRVLLGDTDERTSLRQTAKQKLSAAREALQADIGERHEGGRLRLALSYLFGEQIRLRMATAAVTATALSLYRVIVGGFTYYDWFAALFCALVAPAATMVYSLYLDGRHEIKWAYLTSAAFLLFSLISSSVGLRIGAYPLSYLLAFFFTLYACLCHGTAVGCVAGALCGVAIDLAVAPAFLLSGMVFSFFQSKRQGAFGILPAVLCATSWLLYAKGIAQLPVLLPALLVGGACMTPVCVWVHAQREKEEQASEMEERTENAMATSASVHGGTVRLRREDPSERMREISEAFSSLSEVFYNLSDRCRRPGTLDLRCICDRVFESHCADCPSRTVCWGLEYSQTLDMTGELIASLHTRGTVDRSQISPQIASRCPSVDRILEDINDECRRLTGELLQNNRTEIFAMDYEAAASIISDALEEDAGEYARDPALEAGVAEYLRDVGVRFASLTVLGKRRLQILLHGVDVEDASVTAGTMCSDLGEMCGVCFAKPSFEVDNGICTMVLRAKRRIAVEGAHRNVAAEGSVSGDTVNLFSNRKDYFYALINDGMGAGREAALTSGLCSVFLERMLRAGNRAWTSLRMLNNLIRSRGASSAEECSCTVDLLELDLMRAEASFLKSGAAPSLVVRGTTVYRLQAGTPPIGILGSLDAQVRRFSLKAGDTVVLISDGIEVGDPELRWLTGYLATCSACTPEEIVYCICRHASEGGCRDDCSAIALRILDAEE